MDQSAISFSVFSDLESVSAVGAVTLDEADAEVFGEAKSTGLSTVSWSPGLLTVS